MEGFGTGKSTTNEVFGTKKETTVAPTAPAVKPAV
jgi:hypothetical protein